MKRYISLLLTMALLVSLAACGTKPNGATEVPPTADPTQHPTAGEQTQPQPTEPVPTQPAETVPAATRPPETQPAATECNHRYQQTDMQSAGCITVGISTYTCENCGDSYRHQIPATGHSYDITGICTGCGQQEPGQQPTRPGRISFTVKIKSDKNKALSGVTVTVTTDDPRQTASGSTDKNGVVTFSLEESALYRVELTEIPTGYTGNARYQFTDIRANITLKTAAAGHANANYKVGSKMQDFTVTDTDGNTYTLSRLLEEKQLVILNFWYVSCAPCKEEFPYFETAHQRYGDKVQILAMSHFDSEQSIRALKEQMGLTFPMISERLGFQEGFGLSSYPTTVIINSSGIIISIQTGAYNSEGELMQILQGLTQ